MTFKIYYNFNQVILCLESSFSNIMFKIYIITYALLFNDMKIFVKQNKIIF